MLGFEGRCKFTSAWVLFVPSNVEGMPLIVKLASFVCGLGVGVEVLSEGDMDGEGEVWEEVADGEIVKLLVIQSLQLPEASLALTRQFQIPSDKLGE